MINGHSKIELKKLNLFLYIFIIINFSIINFNIINFRSSLNKMSTEMELLFLADLPDWQMKELKAWQNYDIKKTLFENYNDFIKYKLESEKENNEKIQRRKDSSYSNKNYIMPAIFTTKQLSRTSNMIVLQKSKKN